MQELSTSIEYSLTQKDKMFAMELAKIGHVHLLSNQVSLKSKDSIQFKDYLDGVKGLILPDNWVIEYIGYSDGMVHMTFGVHKNL
jgi:hypothetical protein